MGLLHNLVLVHYVFLLCHPFKIAQSVIGALPVNVVSNMFLRAQRNKSL